MSGNFHPDRKLDCLGLFCPVPIIKTRIEIDKMQVGQILEVIADDPAAEKDIKNLMRSLGHEILQFNNDDGKVRFFIRKVK